MRAIHPRNFGVHTANLLSTAFDDAVKTNIVLKRIGADDVVVVAIEDTDSNAACLIDAPRDRFEAYGNVNVPGDNWFKYSKRKTIVRPVGARLFNHVTGKRGVITHDSPLTRTPLTCSCKFKVGWSRADFHFRNGNHCCSRLGEPSEPEAIRAPVIITAAKINGVSGNRFVLFRSMRNHLEKSSVAQSLDGRAV